MPAACAGDKRDSITSAAVPSWDTPMGIEPISLTSHAAPSKKPSGLESATSQDVALLLAAGLQRTCGPLLLGDCGRSRSNYLASGDMDTDRSAKLRPPSLRSV
ncbi:hypothetical protein CBM2634_U150001 [Cupriavidus taiwanensis]|uniref:Uncharacterized protein n=1 Tax=Cupriavidus taiwanensis TaxID=164546 RepID=A0A375JCA9_9BURK|nr:hypothetical protein CBM2634_U150001 [Cupriavidus taiwanensis]